MPTQAEKGRAFKERHAKPGIILLPNPWDAGTAKLLQPSPGDDRGDLTREGLHSFTPKYASPEQVLGQPVSTATDVYSLGIVLYEMLAGTRAFTGRSTIDVMSAILKEPPPELPRLLRVSP